MDIKQIEKLKELHSDPNYTIGQDRVVDLCNLYLELNKAIMDWWQEHQYDTCGPYGEYNVYDESPKFVQLAQKVIK